jgi:hypothetical protein
MWRYLNCWRADSALRGPRDLAILYVASSLAYLGGQQLVHLLFYARSYQTSTNLSYFIVSVTNVDFRCLESAVRLLLFDDSKLKKEGGPEETSVTNANSGRLESICGLDCLKTRILSYRTKGVREVCKLYTQSSAAWTSLRSQVTTRPERVGNLLASCGQTVTTSSLYTHRPNTSRTSVRGLRAETSTNSWVCELCGERLGLAARSIDSMLWLRSM